MASINSISENGWSKKKLAPDFSAQNDGGGNSALKGYGGQNFVLYFYPKDGTPGCASEASDFRDHLENFNALNTSIVGVSRDNLKRHINFSKKISSIFLWSQMRTERYERITVYGSKNEITDVHIWGSFNQHFWYTRKALLLKFGRIWRSKAISRPLSKR